GLVVVEAAAKGTPSVVVAGPENAAVELVEDGVNGAVAVAATADALAEAILRVVGAGAALRSSTADWFAANAGRLRLDASLDVVLQGYAHEPG
ncbi:MAG: glycosyltransferase, partial [Pseudomonadota bacterium]